LEKQNAYQVEKKVIVNLVKKLIKEVEAVHSIKTGLFGKNIRIKQNPEGIDIWLGLIIKRGTSIPKVAQEIQQKLKEEMERTLGTRIRKVDVVVKGVKF